MGFWDTTTKSAGSTGSFWDASPQPEPFIRTPAEVKSLSPSFSALNGGASGMLKTSTPATATGPSTLDFFKGAAGFAKDVFTGGNATAGGIARNTIIGLPKAGVDVAKGIATGLKDQITRPDAEQQNFESTMLPYAPKSDPITRVVTAPGVAAARFITRVVNPGLRPIANDIAEITAINEKGGIADQVAAGKIPASYLDELAVLHRTAPQIVGDVAQAVLTAYAGGEGANLAEGSVNTGLTTALKTGFKSGLQAGETFGLAQSLSSGSRNPFEILGTIGTSGVAGGVLGALISGALPATKEVVAKAKEAKALYDSLTPFERQGGYIRNPLAKKVPAQDIGEMRDYVDYKNGSYNPTDKEAFRLEKAASDIAGKYGFRDNPRDLHIQFGKYLDTIGLDKKIVKSDLNRGVSEEIPSKATSQADTSVQEPLPENPPRRAQPTSTNLPKEDAVVPYSSKVPQDFNPDKYVQEQLAKREAAASEGKVGVAKRTTSLLSEIKAKLVDFTAPIEDLLRKNLKKNDITLLPSEDIHNQIDRVLRAPTIAGQFAKDHGIIDVIRTVDNPDRLDQYLIAKHAIELDNAGIKTGRNIAKDEALVNAYASKYEGHAQTVSKYSDALLAYSVKAGLISKEIAGILRSRYPDYVPFNRVFNELEKNGGHGTKAVASLSKQTAVQRIVGSDREIESPLRSLLAKTNDIVKQGEKNIAGKLLAGYERLPGNPFQLKELKSGETGPHTISFFDKGEKRTFETTKEISDAAKALDVQQLNILGKIFALPTRVARIGITGINLPFIGANLAKDQITAFINSNHGLRSSVLNPENFVRSLFSAVKHDALYEEMVRAGGAGTSFDIARNQVESTFDKIRADRNIATKALYTVTHPGELLRAVEDIINRGEEMTRIQQYRGTKEALLKKGMSSEDAVTGGARAARESTVNFQRRGEWGTVLNSAFLYLNAGIQGTRTLLGNLRDHPVKTTTKIVASAMFPVAVATAWNVSDPERKKAYDDIAEYEKQNNIIIIPPHPTQDAEGRWNVIKIPLSQEINNVVSLARRPIEQAAGMKPLAFKDFADAVLGTVSPIAPTRGSITSTVVPQAIKPTIEGITNTNLFTGIPQVPKSLDGLPADSQVKSYTSGTARIIGNKLNVSPIKVEEWIKGTFGGVGSQAVNAVDEALAKVGTIPKDQIGGQNILDGITARFAKARGGQSDQDQISGLQKLVQDQAGDRYDLKLEAEKLDHALQTMPKETANAKVKEIQKNNPQLFTKLKDVVEQRKLNLDYSEKLMLQLGVTNGARAKYINSEVLKLPSSSERNGYVQDLIEKKIVTAEVLDQLKNLRKKK